MQAATGALCQNNLSEDEVKILDLCMAPGGYTASALKYNPRARAVGITLPPDIGGHEVFLNSYRSTVFTTTLRYLPRSLASMKSLAHIQNMILSAWKGLSFL